MDKIGTPYIRPPFLPTFRPTILPLFLQTHTMI